MVNLGAVGENSSLSRGAGSNLHLIAIVVNRFPAQSQIICHRGVVKGINANYGNPLYDFVNWEFVE